MPRRLKVFRTPIGFHDAYVAAPSQKAALSAWGSDANLFARGVAEEVTDPALMAEPLAHPGEVVRTLRGTADEQLAALPADTPKRKATRAAAKPRPSRAKLDAAEQALDEAEAALAAEKRRLDDQAAEIARAQAALRRRTDKEIAALTERRDAEEAAYRQAMDA